MGAADDLEPTTRNADADYGLLWDAHHVAAYRLAVLLCGDTGLAEEAVSDAFARVFPPWQAGRVDDFGPYLRRAIVNEVRGSIRRRVLERRPTLRAMPRPAPRRLDDQVVDRDALLQALAQLPQRQRAAVVLFYYEDRPLEEIATIMGTSVGTAKAHLSRGRDQLRRLLEGGDR